VIMSKDLVLSHQLSSLKIFDFLGLHFASSFCEIGRVNEGRLSAAIQFFSWTALGLLLALLSILLLLLGEWVLDEHAASSGVVHELAHFLLILDVL